MAIKITKLQYTPFTDKQCEEFFNVLMDKKPPGQEDGDIVSEMITIKADVELLKRGKQFLARIVSTTSTHNIGGYGDTKKKAIADLKLALKERINR